MGRYRIACYAAAALCLAAGPTSPFAMMVAAFALGLPTVIRAAAGGTLPREAPAPTTIEQQLRAQYEAGTLDTIDFALAVDRVDDLDAPVRRARSKPERAYKAKHILQPGEYVLPLKERAAIRTLLDGREEYQQRKRELAELAGSVTNVTDNSAEGV